MRWSTQTFLSITLAACFSATVLAQRGSRGEFRGSTSAAPPSSTAIGMGATVGRPAFPSSTAIGAGAPTRSSLNRSGFASSGGYYARGTSATSRAGYGRRGGRSDYRNLPFPYFLTPYYYPSLDYGSAPYGGGPEDMPEDPNAEAAFMAQNALGQQVMRLTAEIEQLKTAQQQSPFQAPPEARQPEPVPPVTPVTVVLHNGQKLQVQNYAIMDQTFWDFSRQPARKIPLSSIDFSASSQATAASGGEFPHLDSKQ